MTENGSGNALGKSGTEFVQLSLEEALNWHVFYSNGVI